MIEAANWIRILVSAGVKFTVAVKWAPLFERHVQASKFSKAAREIDDFVGQALHETAMLTKLEESLNYSAKRLTEVWPKRFPTLQKAMPYAMNPAALANFTYGGRLGNTEPGDGWKYRGQGIPQVTGRANFTQLARLTGKPLVDHPELLLDPETALCCGVAWWEANVPDAAIDDASLTTKAVQGGQLGLAERRMLIDKVRAAIAQFAP